MTTESSKGLVLLVEDERPIADLQRMYLRRDGFGVHICADGRSGLSAARTLHPVAIVLDIRLPELDGLEVCKALRADGNRTPILFVTARDDEADRILGLEMGADDYLTKPFSPRELVARVKAVLRRGADAWPPPILTNGLVSTDVAGRGVRVGEAGVELTATEFDLLAHLLRRPGQVFSREQLLAQVWGHAGPGSRTVDVHVAQLRSKLGDACPIRTFRGVGYGVDRP
ncbi:response regulator transcription factor [Fodinicola feengrottensis]|uniref:Response regulator transcription factor n=1 Tax=Fodinicola feengrottensis TaxID=435914 RepID=A0ABP4V288_9ACTN|nr:response regulator transcription factor [Fodinicola feengrottensis]